MILVDTNVLLDVVTDDRRWGDWSLAQLETTSLRSALAINPIIYSELSISFSRIEELEKWVSDASLSVEAMPREALFLAGKVFLDYRRRRGAQRSVLPDFFIGAHAAVMQWPLLTRDAGRYRSCFPGISLICPD